MSAISFIPQCVEVMSLTAELEYKFIIVWTIQCRIPNVFHMLVGTVNKLQGDISIGIPWWKRKFWSFILDYKKI